MSAGKHEHPSPLIPPLDNSMYDLPGETDPTPIAALLGAAAAECQDCYRTQLIAVAANPLLTTHLAACGYLVLKTRAKQTGVPIPDAQGLANTYVSTTAAMFLAFSLDGFTHALMFAEKAEPAKRTASVEENAKLFVDFMRQGNLSGLGETSAEG